jgi:hypothetical protein
MFELMNATDVDTAMSFTKDDEDKAKVLTTAEFLVSAERERKAWEHGIYVEANKQLYAVLARCYAFVISDSSIDGIKARSSALMAFYAERNYTYRESTPLASRVVRAVFGNVDRRRISTYSIVIRKAQRLKISASDFANWIEREGGVQEIKLGRSANYVSKKDKAAAVAKKWKRMQTLAIADDKALRQQRQSEFDGKHCLLVAMQKTDGTYDIKGVVHTEGIVAQAMATLQSATNAEDRTIAKEKEQVIKQAANDAQVKEAA